jgi:inner membrane protein
MAPDLDVLIRSEADPLLGLMLHRHFTHATLFAPVGGLLVALLTWTVWRRLPFATLYLFATLGWFSHAFLDVATSYGTYMGWPVSHRRYALDIVSIIDLAVTVPLLIALALAWRRRSRRWAVAGVAWVAAWFGAGAWQHGQALEAQARLAEQRGHVLERGRVMPTIGNLVLWRSVYLHDGAWHTDALRVGPFSEDRWYPGASVPAWSPRAVGAGTRLRRDVDRFAEFSDGYLAVTGREGTLTTVGDLRYGLPPEGTQPLWGIRFDAARDDRPANFVSLAAFRSTERLSVWQWIKGGPCDAPKCYPLAP